MRRFFTGNFPTPQQTNSRKAMSLYDPPCALIDPLPLDKKYHSAVCYSTTLGSTLSYFSTSHYIEFTEMKKQLHWKVLHSYSSKTSQSYSLSHWTVSHGNTTESYMAGRRNININPRRYGKTKSWLLLANSLVPLWSTPLIPKLATGFGPQVHPPPIFTSQHSISTLMLPSHLIRGPPSAAFQDDFPQNPVCIPSLSEKKLVFTIPLHTQSFKILSLNVLLALP
jgi:hypothetical protein